MDIKTEKQQENAPLFSLKIRLINELKKHKYSIYSIAIFTAITNILMLIPSIYMLQVYDRVLSSNNTMTLLMLTFLVIAAYLFIGILEWFRSLMVNRMGLKCDLALHHTIFDAIFQQQLQYPASQSAQTLQDINTLRQFATGNALFALFDAPWFLLFLSVIFLLHPWLGYFALAGAISLCLLAWFNHRYTHHPVQKANQMTFSATQQATMHLRNTDVIEAMGMLKNIRQRWSTCHHAFLAHQQIANERQAITTIWSKTLRLLLQSLVLGLGAWLVILNEITAGMMIAASILMGRVLSPIDQLIAVSKQFHHVKHAYQRLAQLLDSFPPSPRMMRLPAPKGELSVENLLYRPDPTRPPVLFDVNFSLSAGEVLCIIGASGSGKSTLARLLTSTLSPTLGDVRLDGANLFQLDKQALGSPIGYLPQDIQLFSGTIAENIARFHHVDAEKVISAATLAGAHDIILSLHNGYDTQLGECGSGLSGGQKQLIALARAVYDNPKFIILDEPNANLDNKGCHALSLTLEKLKQQHCTVIIITHNPDFITHADKLLILQSNSSPRFGSPRELLKEAHFPKP